MCISIKRLWGLMGLLVMPPFAVAGEKMVIQCSQGGRAEVVMHLYQHVSVLWEDRHFYIADARRSKHGHYYTFTNGDVLFIGRPLRFLYTATRQTDRCVVLSTSHTLPLNVGTSD